MGMTIDSYYIPGGVTTPRLRCEEVQQATRMTLLHCIFRCISERGEATEQTGSVGDNKQYYLCDLRCQRALRTYVLQ